LYFNLLSASFVCRYCHIYQCACFLFLVFNYYICPICCKFSVCVYGYYYYYYYYYSMALQSSVDLCLLNVPLPVSSAFWPLLPVFNFALIPFQVAVLISLILLHCLSWLHSDCFEATV
jgi:hypothetical protein